MSVDDALKMRDQLKASLEAERKIDPHSKRAQALERIIRLTEHDAQLALVQQKTEDDHEAFSCAIEKGTLTGNYQTAVEEAAFFYTRAVYTKKRILKGAEEAEAFLNNLPHNLLPYAEHIRNGTTPEF